MKSTTYLAIGVSVGALALYYYRHAPVNLLKKYLRGGEIKDSVNYLRITIPFVVSDMSVESARRVADSLKPREVIPTFSPPGLKFVFNPIVIPFSYGDFVWQPSPYQYKLMGSPADAKVRSMAKSAYKAGYRTTITDVPGGKKITFILEVPL